jgi:hypothetical protein
MTSTPDLSQLLADMSADLPSDRPTAKEALDRLRKIRAGTSDAVLHEAVPEEHQDYLPSHLRKEE